MRHNQQIQPTAKAAADRIVMNSIVKEKLKLFLHGFNLLIFHQKILELFQKIKHLNYFKIMTGKVK